MECTLAELNNIARRIKLFVDGQLSQRLKTPVIIDDETARAIAMRMIFKNGGDVIWLNGNQENLKDLRLQLKLISPSEDTTN